MKWRSRLDSLEMGGGGSFSGIGVVFRVFQSISRGYGSSL
jgi:hypothetical protein